MRPKTLSILLILCAALIPPTHAQTLDTPIPPESLNARVAIEIALDRFTLLFPEDKRLPSLNDYCYDEYEAGEYSEETLADIKSAIETNREAMTMIENAVKLKTFRSPTVPDPIPAEYVQLNERFRNLARFLYDASLYYTQINDADSAIRCIVLMYQLADMFGKDEVLQYTDNSVRSIGKGAEEWLSERVELTEEQHARLASFEE